MRGADRERERVGESTKPNSKKYILRFWWTYYNKQVLAFIYYTFFIGKNGMVVGETTETKGDKKKAWIL